MLHFNMWIPDVLKVLFG